MKNLKYVLFTTLFLISIPNIFSVEKESMVITSFSLHIRITEMTESEEPFIVADNLVFTYLPSKSNVRHVGIAFENENFGVIHNLQKNENGVYFYIYKYPREKEINYKFIEDGIWLINEKSRTNYTDKNFIQLSSFSIPDKNIKDHISPNIDGQKATFSMRAEEKSSIYLTGDFNSWNPFLYKLEEVTPGQFSISLNLPKGKYGYYFILNGERILDSENPFRGRSRIGEDVSIFTIK